MDNTPKDSNQEERFGDRGPADVTTTSQQLAPAAALFTNLQVIVKYKGDFVSLPRALHLLNCMSDIFPL